MKKKTAIKTKKAPAPVGPYSQAVIAGNFLFISGQIGIDPENGKIVDGGVEIQTKQIFKNIGNILNKAGSSESKVVKATVYLRDMKDFSKVNDIYAKFFSEPFPSRAAVEVSSLPLNVRIEIDIIALI